jgi:hypothetical protein
MKSLIKSTIWAGALLSVLLVVQPPSANAQDCGTSCFSFTPCSSGCFLGDFGYGYYTTCGASGYPCCEDSAFIASGECNTRKWIADTGKCKEKFYDWYQYRNYCNDPPTDTFSFVLVFQEKFSSTQAQCPDFNNCPA